MARKAGRTKPMSPKAGVTKTRRRYGCGGKVNKNLYKEGGTVFTKDNAYGNCFSIFGKYSFFLFWS